MAEKKDTPTNSENYEYNSNVEWVTEITEKSAIDFHENLFQRFKEDPFKPIVIKINSYGGEVDALFSMLDTMDSIRSVAPPEFKFITVTTGKAQSAAAVLLSYGDVRFATPMSRIMIHQVIGGAWGSQPANEVEFTEIARMNTRLLDVLRRQCKAQSVKSLKQALSHNVYMTPNQAKDFGIVDIIGYPEIIEVTLYDVRVLNTEPPKKAKKNEARRANKSAPQG